MIIARLCPCPQTRSNLHRQFRTMTAISTTIGFDWNDAFSPENKARTVATIMQDKNRKDSYVCPKDDPEFRKAAVLIPLCYDVLGRPSLLYNLRAMSLSRHSGEISFPGGTVDPEDNGDCIAAALRETEEELGISPSKVEIWTTARDFPTINFKMGVTPVLGFINDNVNPADLQVNPAEVDHAFTVTLEHLCAPANWGSEMIGNMSKFLKTPMPTYTNLEVYNKDGSIVDLWGLTAFLTHLILSSLLPKQYLRKVPFIPSIKQRKNTSEQSGSSDSEQDDDSNAKKLDDKSPTAKL